MGRACFWIARTESRSGDERLPTVLIREPGGGVDEPPVDRAVGPKSEQHGAISVACRGDHREADWLGGSHWCGRGPWGRVLWFGRRGCQDWCPYGRGDGFGGSGASSNDGMKDDGSCEQDEAGTG